MTIHALILRGYYLPASLWSWWRVLLRRPIEVAEPWLVQSKN